MPRNLLSSDKIWQVTITCPSECVEDVSELFTDDAVSVTIMNPPMEELPSQIMCAIELIYENKPSKDNIKQKLGLFADAKKLEEIAFTIGTLDDINWVKEVSANFPPINVGRWFIHSIEDKESAKDTPMTLQIEASNAFGTGEHPTTAGCLRALDKLITQENLNKDTKLLDMGCGSCILSLAFAITTKGKAFAIDIDEKSYTIARDNITINDLDAYVHVELNDGYKAKLVEKNKPFDIIISNIFADPLCEMAPDLSAALRENGWAILSGFLVSQKEAVRQAYENQGFTLIEDQDSEEWTTYLLQKRG